VSYCLVWIVLPLGSFYLNSAFRFAGIFVDYGQLLPLAKKASKAVVLISYLRIVAWRGLWAQEDGLVQAQCFLLLGGMEFRRMFAFSNWRSCRNKLH